MFESDRIARHQLRQEQRAFRLGWFHSFGLSVDGDFARERTRESRLSGCGQMIPVDKIPRFEYAIEIEYLRAVGARKFAQKVQIRSVARIIDVLVEQRVIGRRQKRDDRDLGTLKYRERLFEKLDAHIFIRERREIVYALK